MPSESEVQGAGRRASGGAVVAIVVAALLATVTLALSVGGPGAASAQEGFTTDRATLFTPADCTSNCIVAGDSSIIRSGDVVTYSVRARHLDRSRAYVLWAFVFNAPEACVSSPCGNADLGDPATGPSLFRLSGGSSDDFGNVLLSGLINDRDQAASAVFGAGLTNPAGAEMHFVLRDHGIPGRSGFQGERGSYYSGCTPDVSRCENKAMAIHD